ncbi:MULTISPECIES: heme utilization protein HutZ [Enterovibrio]|uniref:Heme utilization protein HutZ n=1 Tax=Enterovibrio norvegicus TaxID=188144 RepID=A0A2N7LH12_9GAMM|nr:MULTISPECIES: heme utilization protein HutZ [Enterovibrio]MBE1273389.1 heme utilization protein HutZ [Enterovibrio baiacu]OEE44371.1 heme utilization protein HutZ [Enterovibrio norvegicus]PMH67824.1 heme utilization protein HutZ [Enterovibrio norvegicus]PML78579.1 heme utilization protein HutZ [Enterovibrio norvegicus]PMN64445.1 heme utilization protein HutZ [Enterovibrio norvegicus]
MIDKAERLQNRLGPEIQEFRDARKTLQLGTVDKDGKPHTSYAPFAFSEQGYYILVSDLATHGQNLKHSKAVSIMMIEDENEARSIFARRRLSFDTNAELIERESALWQQGIDVMQTRLGEMIDNLSQLGDFRLYRLNPVIGRYVKGFGQAFDVTGEDLLSIVHLNEGHVQKMKEGM